MWIDDIDLPAGLLQAITRSQSAEPRSHNRYPWHAYPTFSASRSAGKWLIPIRIPAVSS